MIWLPTQTCSRLSDQPGRRDVDGIGINNTKPLKQFRKLHDLHVLFSAMCWWNMSTQVVGVYFKLL